MARIRLATVRGGSAFAACFGLLVACDGTPGESRLQVLSRDAAPLWEQTLAAQSFSLARDVPGDDILRVSTSDYCWDANDTIDFDLGTGARLSKQPSQSYDSSGGCLAPPGPPTACEVACPLQRLTLSNGELIDICPQTPALQQLSVINVASRSERFVVQTGGVIRAYVSGDILLLEALDEARVAAFSLDSGAALWSWTPPEVLLHVAGVDGERAYVLSEPSGEIHAFALLDGAVVWQKNLSCEWLALVEDLLVCGQTLRRSTCEQD